MNERYMAEIKSQDPGNSIVGHKMSVVPYWKFRQGVSDIQRDVKL